MINFDQDCIGFSSWPADQGKNMVEHGEMKLLSSQ